MSAGATASQVSLAAGAALDEAFGVEAGTAQVEVFEPRRRLLGNWDLNPNARTKRRLTGDWNVQYYLIIAPHQADAIEARAQAVSEDAMAFSSTFAQKLQATGVEAEGLAIASFPIPTITRLSESNVTTTKTTITMTSTVTTTTTTSPAPLELLSAQLTRHFADLELSFSAAVRLVGEGPEDNQMFQCSAAFTDEVAAALGSLPLCVFSGDRRKLRATLGSRPTIAPGDLVVTREGSLVHGDHPGWPTVPSMKMVVTTLEEPVAVKAVVVAMPPTTQACGKVTLSSDQSSGSAGRALTTRWRFGPATPSPMRPYLQAALTRATAENAALVQISPQEFSAAVGAMKAMLGEAYYRMEVVFDAEATVTNWLGESDTASASVIVLKEQEPLPQISPDGPTVLEANRTDTVSFSVTTATLAPDAVCEGNTGAAGSRRVVVVTWEYRMAGAAEWSPLDGSGGIVDSARPPNVVRFDPNTFQANTQISFRATAAYPDTAASTVKPKVEFSLSIGADPPPQAVVNGPQEANTLCEFVLDATGSSDPISPTAPVLSTEWSCAPLSPGGPSCSGLLNFQTARYSRTDGSGAQGSVLRVAGGQLQEGAYVFSATVRRTMEANGPSDTSSLTVQVRSGAPPPVTISAPWDQLGVASLSGAGMTSSVIARSTGSALCPIPKSWAWQWALVREDTGDIAVEGFLNSATEERAMAGSNMSLSSVEVSTSDWQISLLEPGRKYSYALLRANSEADLLSLDEQGLTLARVEAAGVAAMRTKPFRAMAVPSSGIVSVVPAQGEAIKTQFSISTSGWFTEDSSLEYAFYAIPVQGAGIQAASNFTMPTIDWDDKDSALHFQALGGRELRSWGAPTVVTDVVLSAGQYFMAVRARDSLGGTGLSVVFGPVASEPSGGVTQAAITAALDTSLASNDPDKILNTADSVTMTSMSEADDSVQATVVSQVVASLESVVRIVEADTAGVDKVSQVVTRVLNVSKSAEVLTRISNVVDKTIDAAMTSGGVTKEGGDSVLSSMLALSDGANVRAQSAGSSKAGGGVVSETEALAEARTVAERVQRLTTKLASAAIRKLQVGQGAKMRAKTEDGKQAEMSVDKLSLQDSLQAGVTVDGLKVQPGSLKVSNSRRLQICSVLGVHQTEWLRSNPYSWVQSSLGYNSLVPLTADVKLVDLDQCGSSVSPEGITAPMQVSLRMPPVSAPAPGYRHELTCSVFNTSTQAWDSYGVQLEVNASTSGPTVNCLTTQGTGAYVAFWLPVLLPTTSTTRTTVTATSTVTRTTTVTPEPAVTTTPQDITLMVALSISGGVLWCCCMTAVVTAITFRRGKRQKISQVHTESSVIAQKPMEATSYAKAQIEVDAHFWEWAREWAGSRRLPPFYETGSDLGLARIPDPPPLLSVERPPISPTARMPGLPDLPDLPDLTNSLPDRMESATAQGVQVVVDEGFWDWAREWARLRDVATGEGLPGRPTQLVLPAGAPRAPPDRRSVEQRQYSHERRRNSLEQLMLVDGGPRQIGPAEPILRQSRLSDPAIQALPAEAWGPQTPPPPEITRNDASVEFIREGSKDRRHNSPRQ